MNEPAQSAVKYAGITQSVTGVLLAGGQSRRMGGGDKGLLELAGKPMLAHVLARLEGQVDRVVINANGDPGRFDAFNLPVFADTIEGHVGPLAGVLAGMRWAAANVGGDGYIVTASTDAPLIPADLVTQLAAKLRDDPDAAIALAASGGNLHPVIGLWPVALADDLEQSLRDGVRKVLHWTDQHGTVIVDFAYFRIGEREIDPFFNANTPDELDEARLILGEL
ncbi:Molybdenum cofactor guanylyltransferase [Candidatus Filomicrobium marinum]|uniref:Molybdenum cofactor guanylyltransferase n=1 Tax=Candidatus Filomicrobium marinum TaxID=1608628 RepID=A0A0D6JE77_9HYPH|nr:MULTISPECIES: molybdenum cofactor guanylyltransferase MobA [Filomicrobium]CFX17435.1 Molybdenum cofactor guanylyltransferase [Candidatus Filomicrobium marinum]CPR18247.1 Molybdenum cofactor guanylyltransferase [Candidatus Filomicrobium marinum]